jgi:outer membrane protein OmpA-like peptidoglycan-associated protein
MDLGNQQEQQAVVSGQVGTPLGAASQQVASHQYTPTPQAVSPVASVQPPVIQPFAPLQQPLQQQPVLAPQQIAVTQSSEIMQSAQPVAVFQESTVQPSVDSQNSQVQQEFAFDRSSIQKAFTNAIKKCKTALKKLMESQVKKHAKHPSHTYHAVKKMLNGSGSFMNKYQHLKVQLHQLEDSKKDDVNSSKLSKRAFTGFKPAVTLLRDVRKEIL